MTIFMMLLSLLQSNTDAAAYDAAPFYTPSGGGVVRTSADAKIAYRLRCPVVAAAGNRGRGRGAVVLSLRFPF